MRSKSKLLLTCVAIWPLLCCLSAQAASLDYRAFNVAVAEHYLVPRYQRLAETTTQLSLNLERFCADPNETTLQAAQAAFHDTMDVWMGLQSIRFGPVTLAFRAERIHYWPERRNAVERSLRKHLSQQDPAKLEPNTFAKGSVAVQGLPALERLLFAVDAKTTIQSAIEDSYRCQLMQAAGQNLASIAAELVMDWRDDIAPALATGAEHPIYFSDSKEVTTQLFTDLQTLLQLIADLKLEKVLGDSTEKAKPKLAENYRSGRSVRNIVLNLENAHELYTGDHDTGAGGFRWFVRGAQQGNAKDAAIQAAFKQALTTARSLPKPLEQAVLDPSRRPQVEAALKAVKALQKQLRIAVTEAAQISLGFNSLDGD